MPSKKSLTRNVLQVELGNPDDPLKISFLPGMVSPKNLKSLMKFGAMGKNATTESVTASLDGIVELLHEVILEWNLNEDDDPSAIVPLTFEGISGVGFTLLQDISEAIFTKVSVPETSGTISPKPMSMPSSPKASSTNSRRGSSRTRSKSSK
jgi:hypothetical protein